MSPPSTRYLVDVLTRALTRLMVPVPACLAALAMQASVSGFAIAQSPPEFDEAILREMYEEYKTKDPETQVQLQAIYQSMGVDVTELAKKYGESTDGQAGESKSNDDQAAHANNVKIMPSLRSLKFTRTPEEILAARSRIGLAAEPLPAADASSQDLAQWIHRHVLAGEWEMFKSFLETHGGDEAEEIYAHVLSSTNHEKTELLPEGRTGAFRSRPW